MQYQTQAVSKLYFVAAIGLFVARLHADPAAVAFYGALLESTGGGAGLFPLIVSEAERSAGSGPYGAFHAENAPESTEGPVYEVSSVEATRAHLDRIAEVDGTDVQRGHFHAGAGQRGAAFSDGHR